jgi:hypothetical protein
MKRLMRKATSNAEAASQRRRKEDGKDYGQSSLAELVSSVTATLTMYAETDPEAATEHLPMRQQQQLPSQAPSLYTRRCLNCENENADRENLLDYRASQYDAEDHLPGFLCEFFRPSKRREYNLRGHGCGDAVLWVYIRSFFEEMVVVRINYHHNTFRHLGYRILWGRWKSEWIIDGTRCVSVLPRYRYIHLQETVLV